MLEEGKRERKRKRRKEERNRERKREREIAALTFHDPEVMMLTLGFLEISQK